MNKLTASLGQRRLLAGALVAGLLAADMMATERMAQAQSAPVQSTQVQSDIIVISRGRLLDEAEAARRLSDAEAALSRRLQDRINDTKAALSREEAALARERGELTDAEFETRAADFDHRVRQARRVAQERVAILQNAFREAREKIVAALPGLIEKLRAETGASIVLDADQVLAFDGAIDMTDRAIVLFNTEGPSPPLPEIDFSGPLLTPPAGESAGEGTEEGPGNATGEDAPAAKDGADAPTPAAPPAR